MATEEELNRVSHFFPFLVNQVLSNINDKYGSTLIQQVAKYILIFACKNKIYIFEIV